MNRPDTFAYKPLDPPTAIRLLRISPRNNSPNGILEVELWQAHTEASHTLETYICLSYVWGDQTEQFEILVNRKSFFVGRNLHDFL